LEFAGVISAPGYYAWVFRFGAVFFMANVFIAVFLFKEIPRSGNVRTVGDVVNNIKVAFKDKKFLVMVILVGCFWALYSTFLNVLPMVLIGFHLVPIWFTAMVIAIFNPATIIFLGPFLIKPSEKIESIRWLMGGVLVYSIGLSIIGLTLQWQLVIIGIIVASIGEFMVAPGYLAFVSKLAPKDKVSAYIGCNFLSTMLGITLGTLVFGLMASYIAIDLQMPNFTYGILISIALVLLVGFIAYYRTWGQDIIERARRIREMEEGIDEDEEDYKEPIFFKIFDNRLSMIIPLLVIPIILFASLSMGTKVWYGVEDDEPIIIPLDEITILDSTTGYTDENSYSDVILTLPEEDFRLTWVNCSLSWTDEGSSYLQGTNDPDNFQVVVIAPNDEIMGESGFSTSSVSVSVELNYTIASFKESYLGDWTIRVEAGNCGDDSALIPFLGLRTTADTGNSWSLAYSYVHLVEVKTPA
jgi:hypothetical protein